MDLIQSGTMGITWRQRRAAAPLITIALSLGLFMALVAGWLLVTSTVTGTAQAKPTPDTSYDRIEAIRNNAFSSEAMADRSYDDVEALRGRLVLGAAASDGSYDAVERMRAAGVGH